MIVAQIIELNLNLDRRFYHDPSLPVEMSHNVV